jgi:hypothetical protein
MPNGKKRDHPLTDILYRKLSTFSEEIDELVTEIVELGGRKELEQTFNLFAPPPLPEFEQSLKEIRDRLRKEAKQRGWEI